MKREWSKEERAHWAKTQGQKDQALRLHQARYPLRSKPVVTKLLMVSNDFFSAAAVWTKRDNVWSCTEAAPILSWMRTTPLNKVSIELLKRGCRWSWNSPAIDRDKSSAGHELANKALGKDSKNTAHEKLTEADRPPAKEEGAGPGMVIDRLDEYGGGNPIVTDGDRNYVPEATAQK